MSRTNKTTNAASTNPASKFIEWSSMDGQWQYYSKDEKKTIGLPMDMPFIALDQLNTTKGYHEKKRSGLWSNEVRGISDTLTVRSKDGIEAVGNWMDVKANPQVGEYVKFTKSVYAMAKINGSYELVNLQLNGCALTAWIDFTKEAGGDKVLFDNTVISVKEATEERKGAVRFNKPKFSIISRELSPEASLQADNMDNELQMHLTAYLGAEKPEGATNIQGLIDKADEILSAGRNEEEVLVEDAPF